MDFRFENDPPAAGTAPTEIEGTAEIDAQPPRRQGMGSPWARLGVNLAAENLAGQMVGQIQQLLVKTRGGNRVHGSFPEWSGRIQYMGTKNNFQAGSAGVSPTSCPITAKLADNDAWARCS
jgi:hypothetical protein